MLAHSIDIGDHNPVVTIDEHFHEPAVDLFGVKFAQEHEPSEGHKSLNMMAVSGFSYSAYDIVDRKDPGGSVVKRGRYFTGMFPVIGGAHFHSHVDVGGSHEFPPPNDLPDESFQRVQRDFVDLGVVEGSCDDLVGSEETDVQHGSQDAMPEPVIVLHHGVFVIPEEGEPGGQELLQPFRARLMAGGIEQFIERTRVVWIGRKDVLTGLKVRGVMVRKRDLGNL